MKVLRIKYDLVLNTGKQIKNVDLKFINISNLSSLIKDEIVIQLNNVPYLIHNYEIVLGKRWFKTSFQKVILFLNQLEIKSNEGYEYTKPKIMLFNQSNENKLSSPNTGSIIKV